MGFTFTKKATYEAPKGDFRVIVRDAFVKADESLRIVFQITSLDNPVYTYLAGKNYTPGKSQLAEDFVQWLGEKAVAKLVKPDGTVDAGKDSPQTSESSTSTMMHTTSRLHTSAESNRRARHGVVATAPIKPPCSACSKCKQPRRFCSSSPASFNRMDNGRGEFGIGLHERRGINSHHHYESPYCAFLIVAIMGSSILGSSDSIQVFLKTSGNYEGS